MPWKVQGYETRGRYNNWPGRLRTVVYENFISQVGVNLQFYQQFAKFYQKRTKTQSFKNLSYKLFSIEGII